MKRFFLVILIIIPFLLQADSIYLIEDFNSYSPGYNLDKYEIFSDTGAALTTVISTACFSAPFSMKMSYQIPSGNWGAGIRISFKPFLDFSSFEFIRLYIKGDKSQNMIQIQLREDDDSGSSDGETYQSLETPMNFSNWQYIDFALKDFTVVDWSRKGEYFEKTRINAIEVLIKKNDSSVDDSAVCIDDIFLVPYLIYDYFPDKGVIIDATSFSMELFFNLRPDINSLNLIELKNVTDDQNIALSVTYDSSLNKAVLSAPAFTKYKNYKLIIPPAVSFKSLTYTNISYSTNFEIPFSIDKYRLNSSAKAFQFLDKSILTIPANSVSDAVTVSETEYFLTESMRNLINVGKGVSLYPDSLNLKQGIILSVYYDQNKLKNNEDNLSLYQKDGDEWQKIGGCIDHIRKRLSAQIMGFGSYYIFADLLDNPDELFNVELSSKLFTPNDDAINDELVIYFSVLEDNTRVNLSIFNVAGYLIKEVIQDQYFNAGVNFAVWEGDDRYNSLVEDGIYLLKVEAMTGNGESIKLIKPVGVKK